MREVHPRRDRGKNGPNTGGEVTHNPMRMREGWRTDRLGKSSCPDVPVPGQGSRVSDSECHLVRVGVRVRVLVRVRVGDLEGVRVLLRVGVLDFVCAGPLVAGPLVAVRVAVRVAVCVAARVGAVRCVGVLVRVAVAVPVAVCVGVPV